MEKIAEERELAWLWLCMFGELPSVWEKILKITGGPEPLLKASKEEIWSLPEVTKKRKEKLSTGQARWNPSGIRHDLAKKRIHFISREHPDYPEKLKEIPDAPLGLFYKGTLPDSFRKTAAVVGARRCSAYGRAKAAELGRMLAERGISLLSGLAWGVDRAAQEAAVGAGGKTYAVLGCGVDVCYPGDHIALYERILEEGGGILSEFPPGARPAAWHFPVRNRIISGLSDCVVVVEAKEKSGSLITADLAVDQGREVWAVPGRMEDALSRGCNRLISQGACILWDESELFRSLGVRIEKRTDGKKENLGLAKKENMVYSGVDFHDRGVDEICLRTGLPQAEVMEALISLQLRGIIQESTKNCYVRVQER